MGFDLDESDPCEHTIYYSVFTAVRIGAIRGAHEFASQEGVYERGPELSPAQMDQTRELLELAHERAEGAVQAYRRIRELSAGGVW